MTDKSCDSLSQGNELIHAIAEKIDSNQVDIQTKRLYKKYVARKQQEMERKKQVYSNINCFFRQIDLSINRLNSGNELNLRSLGQVLRKTVMKIHKAV